MSSNIYQSETNNSAFVVVSGGGAEEKIDLGWTPSVVFGVRIIGGIKWSFVMWDTHDNQENVGSCVSGATITTSTDAYTADLAGEFLTGFEAWTGDVTTSGASIENQDGQGFKMSAALAASGTTYRLTCLR